MSLQELDREIARLKAERAKLLPNTFLNQFKAMPYKYYVIGIAIALTLGVVQYGVYSIARRAKDIAVAEERERIAKQNDAIVAQFKARIDAESVNNAKLREELAKQSVKIESLKQSRNKKVDDAIGAVTAPKDVKDVAKDVKDILGIEPSITGPDTLSFTLQPIQSWVALKLDRDRLADNLIDTTQQLRLKEQENELLMKDLDYKIQLLAKTEQQVVDYRELAKSWKGAAKRTGFQKFLSFGKSVGQIALTAVIVGVIAK